MGLQVLTTEEDSFVHHFPTHDAAVNLGDEQDAFRAVEAYRFFYPTVSTEAIFKGVREAGAEDGVDLIVLAAGPRHVGFTVNSDTPYASGILDLQGQGPIVVDLPPGPFIGAVNDHHQRWIVDMGLPGPDAGEGGKYLILPPDFTGAVPSEYHVARSRTHQALVALRALPRNNDTRGAIDALTRIRVSPLSKPEAALHYLDVTDKSFDASPLAWEDNLEFWKQLHRVIDSEPVVEEFRPMYGLLAALGIERGQPFAPDQRTRTLLERASRVALAQMRVEGFASRRPDCLVWEDREWEWVGLVSDNGDFETRNFLDLQARERWFVQAILASPAMFRRQVGHGSIYFLAARDETSAYLDGGKNYRLRVPQPVPANLFWSVTAYDSRTRSQVQTPQDNAVLSSLKGELKASSDGSVDLYFGPNAPEGYESQWIQTLPDTGFFLYFRIYGPEAAAFDGSWKPSDLKEC